MSSNHGGGYKAKCPGCGSAMRIRNSEEQTPIFKTMYGECSNLGCGATYNGALTWEYELTPPGIDRPRVRLPAAPSLKRMQAIRDSAKQTNQLDLLEAMEATA